MDAIRWTIDLLLHFDQFLEQVVADYGVWTYAILFAIVFAETGLVVTPFLPGDSLLFAAGLLAHSGSLDVHVMFLLLTAAAILGDTVNYWLGARLGPAAFSGKFRFLNRKHLDRTRAFYEKHGAKTIILARFLPFVRTFAPFVAGVAKMNYAQFLTYNVVGAAVWVGSFLYLGYFLGQLPWVKDSFHFIVFGIIALSIIPIGMEFLRWRKSRAEGRRRAAAGESSVPVGEAPVAETRVAEAPVADAP